MGRKGADHADADLADDHHYDDCPIMMTGHDHNHSLGALGASRKHQNIIDQNKVFQAAILFRAAKRVLKLTLIAKIPSSFLHPHPPSPPRSCKKLTSTAIFA